MKKKYVLTFIFCLATLSLGMGRKAPPVTEKEEYAGEMGTVWLFKEDTLAEPHIRKGLALLHHMTYVGARKEFVKAVEADPESAMGYWGQAMTYIHPLWSDPPSEEDFQKGLALLEEGEKYQVGREADYIMAAKSYYTAGINKNEKRNLEAFAMGWKEVYDKYPADPEAKAFYALAHLSTADPGDKTYVVQKKAGSLGEEVLEIIEDHPGGHHYIIHAYDYPSLAPMGLDVARSYGEIAPAIPHALHMPTHIFTRLGLWDDSIEMNSRSARAALDNPSKGQISLHYPHAVDYLVYAYIQKGEDEKAEAALEELMSKEQEYQTHLASYYTFNAAPARILLERGNWVEAAKIEPWLPANYEKGKFPAMEALTYFTRALGAARLEDDKRADEAIEEMMILEKEAMKTSTYWGKQIKIQYLTSYAWKVYNKDKKAGLTLMREAAELESTTEKHPVTPGEILPARELLGDMLMELKDYEGAQDEYEKTLERSPNRFNSLYGAGRAAELRGDIPTALKYYEILFDQTKNSDQNLEKVEYIRGFIGKR